MCNSAHSHLMKYWDNWPYFFHLILFSIYITSLLIPFPFCFVWFIGFTGLIIFFLYSFLFLVTLTVLLSFLFLLVVTFSFLTTNNKLMFCLNMYMHFKERFLCTPSLDSCLIFAYLMFIFSSRLLLSFFGFFLFLFL